MISHYVIDHHVPLETEDLQFESVDAFMEWKAKWEAQTVTRFRLQGSTKCKTYVHKRFECHRSGEYVGKACVRKQRASKKLQGTCPAEMAVKVVDGRYFVKLLKTHVGHETGNLEELRYICGRRKDKLTVAAEKAGIPVTKSRAKRRRRSRKRIEKTVTDEWNSAAYQDLSGMQKWFEKTDTDESNSVGYQDLSSIRSKYLLHEHPPLAFQNEEINVKDVVQRYEESIRYVKEQGAPDESGRLDDEDFLIVIMTGEQERQLSKHGHNVVVMDGTHGLNPYGFFTHTVLVVDEEDNAGFPVAFGVTNRNDQVVVEMFLECVRYIVGTVKPKTFMSDMQATYRNAWNRVMQPPDSAQYCQWHVHKAWSRNRILRISDARKRSEIKRTLCDLIHELDQGVFRQKYKEFVGTEDEDVRGFVEYFVSTFGGDKVRDWASCYRANTNVNTNMHVESMYKKIKWRINLGTKISSLGEGVECLIKFLVYDDTCGRLGALDDLTSSHRRAERVSEKTYVFERVSSDTWHVQSSKKMANGVTESYVIEKMYSKDCALLEDEKCPLVCKNCAICLHEYQCSCPRAFINNTMCKHIHLLGMKLMQDQKQDQYLSAAKDLAQNLLVLEDTTKFAASCEGDASDLMQLSPLEAKKKSVIAEFMEVCALAKDMTDLEEISDIFVKPLKPLLLARRYETEEQKPKLTEDTAEICDEKSNWGKQIPNGATVNKKGYEQEKVINNYLRAMV